LKLDPSGKKLIYSTYLDQVGTYIYALAIDISGTAYVGGETKNTTFPTTRGAYQVSVAPSPVGEAGSDGFVSRFDTSGKTLVFSTFIGGPSLNGLVQVDSIALSTAGVINISGALGTSDFPITPDAAYSSGTGFLARLSPDASALLYSTALPFSSAMALDSSGSSYLLIDLTGLIKIDASGVVGYLDPNVQGTSLVVLGDGTAIVGGITFFGEFSDERHAVSLWAELTAADLLCPGDSELRRQRNAGCGRSVGKRYVFYVAPRRGLP
jgi:hypothetical protein